MKQLWLKCATKIDALALRERAIGLAAAVLVGVYIVFALVIEPTQQRQQLRLAQIKQQKAEIAALETRRHVSQSGPADPDAANRARGEALQRKIDELDEPLRTMHRDLVAAERMAPLLREMLTGDSGLQLVGLRTLPVEALVARTQKPATTSGASPPVQPAKPAMTDANVFKHGVEITLQGSYANLHDYLARLERAPWRMFWWRGRLVADEQARLTLTITIYTLSLDKAWLQV